MARAHGVTAALGIAVVALATIGCGNDPDGPSPRTASKVTIAPTSLALKVGGRGSLTATVTNSSGAVIPNASVTWVSRRPQTATIDNAGSVSALTVGATTVVATSGRVADSVQVNVTADLQLTVEPNAPSVRVGATQPFSVIARNSAGQTVATPAVTWTSSNPQIATVSTSGVATGVAKGTTSITATGGGVTSTPATLTVTEAACNSMINANTYEGTLNYDWASQGATSGGLAVDAEYHGRLYAILTKQTSTALQATWTGDITGSASVTETKRDPATPNATATLLAEGAVVPLSGAQAPKMTLIVDLQQCTYQMNAMVTLNALRTEATGATSRSDMPVASLHAKTRSLGTATEIVLENAPFDVHSQVWSAANPDQDTFIPFGFAVERTTRSATEQAAGRATVVWVLHPK